MYLEKINSPEDLKKLDLKKLEVLAGEIREFLIKSVSETGGHLASNLGVVELTMALHYCFTVPRDKIVWDVGHQAYTHKILTKRKDRFDSLRKLNGLSGFPNPSESDYDSFNAGHSSTSIAAAMGLAKARDLSNANYNVIAVLGDGAMTGGMVYEALNNAGRNNTKLCIILNDNQMSISKNVGAMSNYLNELITAQKYMQTKSNIQNTLSKSVGGNKIYDVLDKTKDSLKNLLMPTSMFEQLGIKYVGPIDGHDLPKLIHVLNRVKRISKPVLLHVITKKGKGYIPAENAPSTYHGVGKFNPETGVKPNANKKLTYSDVFGDELVKLAAEDSRICAVTAAMPMGTGLTQFSNCYPKRFFDVGIAEEYAVTFSAGLAKGGYIPVFAVYSTFLQRGYDQIVHDVCIHNLHVIFAIDRAGIVGDDGETHQGIYDISFLAHIPNLTVMAPKNEIELRAMLRFAVKIDGPVAIRYPRGTASQIMFAKNNHIEYGKAEYIYKGENIALISYGAMMDITVEIYNMLLRVGYSPTIINARFSSPIDMEMIKDLSDNYKYIFTLEDNIYSGGFGCLLNQKLSEENDKNYIIKNFAFPDVYIEHGNRNLLFKKYEMDAVSIYNDIINIIKD